MPDVQNPTPAPAEVPAVPVADAADAAPVADAVTVGPIPKRKRSRRKLELDMTEVEKFKALLQVNLSKVLIGKGQGQISQNLAYELFQEAFDSIVMHTAMSEKKRLSLVGVGRFYIKMSPPRKIATKPTSRYAQLGEIPHFRWKPSFKYFKWLIQTINHVDVERLIETGQVVPPTGEIA
jgi:nucleoid DNA-binding protein